ncbi:MULTISPECIES: SH3 domain-containing protein [unclassified Bacillus (in: firmicutes)]|uniref:SH3 domain-containing protein n=3 Tax=Bacillus TaxID=1386 RepID=UPI001BECCA62|nr:MULTISPECIES: SH3 domain-containing protein [unclassified Bacillus (in: firmicutes)]MBT2617624.1 SH3 domain-containing protein [Bacillus sp. ISL-78]MBT2631683.1 SH3 domain-containing protein [Bacillus sp. ISL-101]
MKKLIIPTFCFAVLSTVAFEEKISAAPLHAEQANIEDVMFVQVNSGSLNMRKTGAEGASIVAKLANGTQVTVYSESKGWAKIKANGKEGYVSAKYLSATKAGTLTKTAVTIKTTTKYVNVSTGSLNMRKSGSDSASIVAKLTRGTQVTVYSESKGWAKVKANGKEGYVSTKYLSATKPGAVKKAAVTVKTTTKYVNVSTGQLNMRKSGSDSASLVAKLTRGTQVTVYSESKGWAKIKANGKDGYVSTKYLSATKPGTVTKAATVKTTTKYVNVSTGSLNMRKSGKATASIVAILSKGTKVTVYSESNGWAKIKANGKDGYVNTKYLSASKPGSGSTAATPVKTTTKYVNVSAGSLNMRKSGKATASIVAILSKGTKVTVYSESNGWAKVKANGKDGYVSTKYLSATKPGTGSTAVTPEKTTTKYVNVSSGTLNMRKSGSESASVVAKLSKGTKVTVYSESKGWAKIKANGKDGHVSTKYLSTTKPGTGSTAVTPEKTTTKYVNISSGTLNMRKSGSESASIVAKLSKGTEVTVYSESKGWAKIKANGQDGYVSTDYLSTTKPGTDSKPSIPEKTTTKYVNVSSGSLNMRNKPSDSASVIVKLARGVEVEVISESNGWSKVKAYGGEGYVSTKYLSATKPGSVPGLNPDGEANTLVKYVNVSDGSSLNMRSAASASASIIAKLVNNTAVTVYSESNGWSRVTANGKTGYVSTQYLTAKAPEGPGSSNGSIIRIDKEYNLTMEKMVEIQMAVNGQTDKKYKTYIREDGVTLINSTKGTVNGTGWRIRGGAGSNYWAVGPVSNNQSLTIKSKVKGSDGYYWYEVDYNKTWVNASPEDIEYNLNPNNFVNDPVHSFQFVKLSQVTNMNVSEVNNRILSGKGILQGQAATFTAAGEKYGVNEIYLISHALLETGNGTSPLATGVKVNGKTVYNMYGVGAFDGTALSSGAQYAYNAGWFTPEAAIIGGAEFIAKGYISAGQDTLYKMRWNPTAAEKYGYASHQYATDIGWATKQVKQIYNLYSLLDSYKLTIEVPKYK